MVHFEKNKHTTRNYIYLKIVLTHIFGFLFIVQFPCENSRQKSCSAINNYIPTKLSYQDNSKLLRNFIDKISSFINLGAFRKKTEYHLNHKAYEIYGIFTICHGSREYVEKFNTQ